MRLFSRIWLCALLLLIILLLLIPSSYASEYIRVALTQEAGGVRIVANRELSLRVPQHETIRKHPPLLIQPDPRGLRINGRMISASKVFIEATRGELSISVTEKKNGKGKASSLRKWVIDGAVEVQNSGSTLLVINRVGLEQYVAGVITGEINTKWHPEALKTQAVAARTYALYKKMMNANQPYDVVASVQDQVYRGRAEVNKKVREAVHSTRSRVMTHQDRPIYAAYSSTAAGPTEDALYVWALDLPYLKGVECPFDENAPRYRWRTAIPIDTLERRLQKEGYEVGTIATVTPYTYTPSGRVDRIRILHSNGQTILRGQDLRRVVGYTKIFSTQFIIESFGHEIIISGKGSGHGVGLCQWGMKEMAELGYNHEAILHYYYPGTKLLHLSSVDLTPPPSP